MMTQVELDAWFLQKVSLIASGFGCKIVDIDLNKRIVNIEGPKDKEFICAHTIGIQVEEYLKDKEREELITTLKGWPI